MLKKFSFSIYDSITNYNCVNCDTVLLILTYIPDINTNGKNYTKYSLKNSCAVTVFCKLTGVVNFMPPFLVKSMTAINRRVSIRLEAIISVTITIKYGLQVRLTNINT